MNNRFVDVEIQDKSVAAALSEIRIVVRTEFITPATRLRGRLMGPGCQFASTVEVAYALRPIPSPTDAGANELAARVVIPEGSLWDPQSPFLYGGPVELWEGDNRAGVVRVRHGLRRLQFGSRGLIVNGQPLAIRARALDDACSDEEALQLRREGYNVLVAPVRAATVSLWDTGDRFGFLLAGRVDATDAESLDRIAKLRRHPSSLGWLTNETAMAIDGSLSSDAIGFLGTID
jgi:hypothetical protein